MVITTQKGKSFLAGAGTGCAITTAPEITPDTQDGDRVKEYYNKTGNRAHVLTWAGHRLGTYETRDRAKKVAADFKNAVDSGAQAFRFPAK